MKKGMYCCLLLLMSIANVACDNSTVVKTVSEVKTISVEGYSEVFVLPNEATVYFSIKHTAISSEESFESVLSDVSEVKKNLLSIGLADDQITQNRVSQNRATRWNNNAEEFIGYQSQLQLKLEIKDLEKLNLIYQNLAKTNAIDLSHIEFKHSDIKGLQKTQSKLALIDARDRAKTILSGLDKNIGDIISVDEKNVVPIHRARGESMGLQQSKSKNIAVSISDIKIQQTIYARFEIK